jgi:hypothetical protein
MDKLPRIGDRVTIPFGTGRIEGAVIDAYRSGIGPWVTLEVHFYGSDEPTTMGGR